MVDVVCTEFAGYQRRGREEAVGKGMVRGRPILLCSWQLSDRNNETLAISA